MEKFIKKIEGKENDNFNIPYGEDKCPSCHGTGYVQNNSGTSMKPCFKCSGTGSI